MKTIQFRGQTYKLEWFTYTSGRAGFMLVNTEDKSDTFNGTLDIQGVKVNDHEIIVKDHGFNTGLFECLVKLGVVARQAKAVKTGLNTAYVVKLNGYED